MHGYVSRQLEREVERYLDLFPAVAILGPRQCGKSTLARRLIMGRDEAVHVDLESEADRRKLGDPQLFFEHYRDRLVCLDEIQRMPGLFEALRVALDRGERNGQVLILGSTSRELIRQSSESLAGRIGYLELTPFLVPEVVRGKEELKRLWLRGGFPRSFLAADDAAAQTWLEAFVRTFLERDIARLGVSMRSETLGRLWTMCAHLHGGLLNASRLGSALGVSHTTIRTYLEVLERTFMLRLLQPLTPNLAKRVVRSPKLYLRDSGLLHELLEIDGFDELLGHPVFGASWEGFALENLVAAASGWRAFFYRTAAGAELDLVLERGRRRLAVEFKASTAPEVGRGFWNAIRDLELERTWVVAPVDEAYPIAENVAVAPLPDAIAAIAAAR